MPDEVQVWCTPLEYHRTLQSLIGLILKMSWWKKPHGHHTISHTMCICFRPSGGFTFTPRKLPEEQRSRAIFNPTAYPPSYEMKMEVQEFCKLCKPKIYKMKGGYLATANLSVMVERYPSSYGRLECDKKRGHSTGQRFHSWKNPWWSWILYWHDCRWPANFWWPSKSF